MTLNNVITDTRRYLKDKTQSIWTDADITAFVNDAIRIVKNSLPLYFANLVPVSLPNDPIAINDNYGFLFGLYASSRCFEQDEQNYRAVQKMNEFENRRTEMINEILDSDEYADLLVQSGGTTDYITDAYYGPFVDDPS